jgi:hypothetical protein
MQAPLGHSSVATTERYTAIDNEEGRSIQDRSGRSIWLLGLIPVFLACLHLIMVSRGNAETLRSLVENVNVTAWVLATTLPLGTTVLTWWFVFFAVTTRRRPPRGRQETGLSLIVVGVFVAFVDFFAMPLYYGVINFVIVAALILCVVGFGVIARLRHRPVSPGSMSRLAKVWALVFVLGPLLIWLGFLGVWLPQEQLTVGPLNVGPAYVLSSDDQWTKYMDGARNVHIVPSFEVECREAIQTSESKWRKTLYSRWFADTRRGDQPACLPRPK